MTEPHANFVLKALTYVSIRAPVGFGGTGGVPHVNFGQQVATTLQF